MYSLGHLSIEQSNFVLALVSYEWYFMIRFKKKYKIIILIKMEFYKINCNTIKNKLKKLIGWHHYQYVIYLHFSTYKLYGRGAEIRWCEDLQHFQVQFDARRMQNEIHSSKYYTLYPLTQSTNKVMININCWVIVNTV